MEEAQNTGDETVVEAVVADEEVSNEQLETSSETNDETVVPEVVEAKKEEKVAPQLALAARKMRLAREAEEKAKDSLTKVSEFEALKAKALEDPLALLQSLGLDWEKHIAPKLLQLEEKEEVLDPGERALKGLEELKKHQAALEEQREQDLIDNARVKVAAIVQKDIIGSDDYELLNASMEPQEAFGEIIDVMEGWYEQTGKPISPLQAAKLIEDHIEEELTKKQAIIAKAKKLKNKFVAAPSNEESNEEQSNDGTRETRPKTMTNSLSSAASSRKVEKEETSDEKFQRIKREMGWLD